MSLSEKIMTLLRERAQAEGGAFLGLDTKTVASALGIWPNNASVALNALVREGKLISRGTRPARYLPAPPEGAEAAPAEPAERPAFENIIGFDGSLRLQLQLARAAAAYPPCGIHTLIVGETGVGKSLLAEEMWRYMQQNSRTGPVPYVVFNCAEYADNPQLLLSQLFGYEKGAFTGADSTHAGLVEKAAGGVLFLDEIHRLPATGQEMLFTLIDKKQFRRMGSTSDRSAELMIIGATTEDPENCFLKTFTRRIPILIQLPSLNDRPVRERLELIDLFLSREANRLNLAIEVSVEALKLMVAFRSKTNIGELRNEIQLCCARSFLLYMTKQEQTDDGVPYIRITSQCLSRKMNVYSPEREKVAKYFESCPLNSIMIYPDGAPGRFAGETAPPSLDFYGFVEDRMNAYNTSKWNADEVAQLVALDLEKQYRRFLYDAPQKRTAEEDRSIFASVPSDIWAAANELVRLAGAEFGRTYSDDTLRTLALYLDQTRSYAKANQVIFDSAFNAYLEPNGEERSFVTRMLPVLREALDTDLTDGEIGIIAMLLSQNDSVRPGVHVGLIVCAYGTTTATSVAEFVNEVLMTDLVQAVNLPISQPLDVMLGRLAEMVRRQDAGRGVIVLTDNEFLLPLADTMEKDTGVVCRVLPWSSAMLALEAAKTILTCDCEIDPLVSGVLQAYRTYQDSLFEAALQPESQFENSTKKSVIFTYCLTGTGSARRARELLLRTPAISVAADIIPTGVKDDLPRMVEKFGPRLKLIIGLLDPHVPGVPFISMETLASTEGINRVLLLLQGWKAPAVAYAWNRTNLSLRSRFQQIAQKMQYFAPSLDAKVVEKQAVYLVEAVEKLYTRKLPDDVLVRAFIHTASMFERIMTSEPVPVPADQLLVVQRYQLFFDQLQEILNEACAPFGCEAPYSEVYFFMLTLPDPETMGEITAEFA